MATNFTTLALIVVAAKEISAAQVGIAGQTVLVLLLVGLASTPAWAPLAITCVTPGLGERALRAIRDQIARHGRSATVGLLTVAGSFFVARGMTRLLG